MVSISICSQSVLNAQPHIPRPYCLSTKRLVAIFLRVVVCLEDVDSAMWAMSSLWGSFALQDGSNATMSHYPSQEGPFAETASE